jgi:hypothetical protein
LHKSRVILPQTVRSDTGVIWWVIFIHAVTTVFSLLGPS